MAAGQHRRSRFHCLTLAHIVAASVVALVLAFAATVVVVVVVLTAGLGPDNVRLSVTHGHIHSAGLLWSSTDFPMFHLKRNRNDTINIYTPAKELTVWVSMDVHDPTGGRAAKLCVDSIRVLDMPYAPSFDGMVHIATVKNTVATGNAAKPCAPWRHNGSASMQLDRWVTIDDPLMLCYISQKYGGMNEFTVMLKVDIMILYPKEEERDSTPPQETQYCWPVTIGNTRRTRSPAVTCKPSQAIDYASNARVLNACDHLIARERLICNTWRKPELSEISCV